MAWFDNQVIPCVEIDSAIKISLVLAKIEKKRRLGVVHMRLCRKQFEVQKKKINTLFMQR